MSSIDRVLRKFPIPLMSTLLLILPSAGSRAGITVENTAQRGDAAHQEPWRWIIFLRGGSSDVAGIKCVTYHLDPSFAVPDRHVCDPGRDPRHAFPYTASSSAPFTVFVDIEYANGTVERKGHRLTFASAQAAIQAPRQKQSGELAQIKELQQQVADLTKALADHEQAIEQIVINASMRDFMNDKDQERLEKRIEQIEEHLNLPTQ